ncbi:MAG: V-type ATP synthase subunit I [bacterium]|nr:V-type ATP synthase subunit I [bacterium]
MAVASMLKISILGYTDIKNRLVDDLHRSGLLEITEIRKEGKNGKNTEDKVPGELVRLQSRLQEIEKIIQGLNAAMKILQPYLNKKEMFFIQQRPELTSEEYKKTASSFRYNIPDRVKKIAEKITELETARNSLLTKIDSYQAWKTVKLDLSELFSGLKKVTVVFGSVDLRALTELKRKLKDTPLAEFNLIHSTGERHYFSVIFTPEVRDRVMENFKNLNIPLMDFSDVNGTVARTIQQYSEKAAGTDEELKEIKEEMRSLTREYRDMLICLDYWKSVYQKEEIKKLFLGTEKTFWISGWIMKKDLKKLEAIRDQYQVIHLVSGLPEKGEEPPVALDNPGLVSPFEMVTKLFGLPSRADIDPTPLFMPFFILYFAICITDAGYGLVLMLASFVFLRKKYISRGTKQLMGVIAICGFVTIIIGILAGGFFGIQFDALPPSLNWLRAAKEKMALLDPLKYPLRLFVLVMGLGLVQITTGIIIRFILQLRDRNYRGAVVDSFSWLMVILGLVLCLTLKQKWLWSIPLLGSALIVFFTSNSRNILIRIFSGIYSFYGITGLFGDVVSHARLFALALSTSVIAMVINIIMGIVYSLFVKIPLVGVPLGIIVMAGGLVFAHIFDILINSLGGFIHTTRLQFVEYFTKFYTAGGTEFSPFQEKLDYVHVK